MKIIIVCLMAILTCSCHQVINDFHSMKRRHEIRRIMRESMIDDLLETNASWLTAAERYELRRMKKDYYYKPRNHNSNPAFVIPGQGWEIRGPLTVAQVEEELIESHESYKELLKIRGVAHYAIERFEETEKGKDWGQFKGKCREGDELYFFTSDKRSWGNLMGVRGYVIIRKDKIAHTIVTGIN